MTLPQPSIPPPIGGHTRSTLRVMGTVKSTVLGVVLAFWSLPVHGEPARTPTKGSKPHERVGNADAFFADPAIRVFDLRVPEEGMSQLGQSAKNYVKAELTEGDTTLADVGVRLKGMTSFRSIHEKASFSMKFDEFVEGQTYRGLKKLMFNNSVQDRTYLSELLATQLFQDAGVPASRVTHARLRLNGRDMGLYVVVEAMNKDFLKRQFGSGKGNLYEGFLQDINGRVEQDNGEDRSRADLQKLSEACALADPKERWEQLKNVLDVDRFVSFIAMEMLTTHWDGYAVHFNNYRLYDDPGTGKMVFITHGLDSLFRRPNCDIEPPLKSIVGTAVLTTPEGRKLYDQKFRTLAKDVFKVPVIEKRMDDGLAKLRQAGLERSELQSVERYAKLMRERIELRATRVQEQLRGVKPETIRFDAAGIGTPLSWREEPDRGEPLFERVKHDGKETLHIGARPESTRASWRSQIFLQPGFYRFEGMACTEMVAGGSARLRVSADSARTGVTSTSTWKPLRHDFEVENAAMDIEIICELNAAQGDVWFDLGSLHVRRIAAAEAVISSRPRVIQIQPTPPR